MGHCEGGFDYLLKTLDDCNVIFALKIGPGAAEFMIRNGKRVFEAEGAVVEIIIELIKDDLLNESG